MTNSQGLSRIAGRGAVVNLGFGIFTTGLAAIQGIVVPRLLGPGDVGLFAVASGGVAVGTVLKQIDLPRKVVQERDVDLHTSFRVAFTLELMLAGSFLVLVLGLAPILASLYHKPELWLLTSVLGATVFSTAFLDLPAAIPYREMNFVARNLFTTVGPLVTFLVTVPAAYLGAGVWSLVMGTVAGFVAAALVILLLSPIKPGLLWDKAVVRRFLRFGWPAWLSGILGLAAAWGAVFAVSATVGVAGVGYFTVAQTWSNRALQVDGVLGDTVFPALCSMQSSLERLRRAFVIVTRISMLWAAPVGFALALFAQPTISLLLGARWQPAVLLMQAEGLGVIVNSIGNSWYLFYGARGNTKPWLVQAIVGVAWTAVVVIPLLLIFGLKGAAPAILVLALGSHALRQYYTTKLFGRLVLATLVWRELLVGVVPAVALLTARAAGWRSDTIASAGAQALVYALVTALAAVVVDRPLVRELLAALRSRPERDASQGPELHDEHAASLLLTSTPRPMAFPLLIAADEAHGSVWVTTRDWPALGRLNLETGEWAWHAFPSFPHAPSPDGAGGCWSALTRSSALVHVDAVGSSRLIDLPRSRELLVTAVDGDFVWVADAGRRVLVRFDSSSGTLVDVPLPSGFIRPDFVVLDAHGTLWVADTHSVTLAVVATPGRAEPVAARVVGPHRSRAMLADPAGAGVWLGAADRPQLTLVTPDGEVGQAIDLAGIPFGLCLLPDGRIAASIKDSDELAVIELATGSVEPISLPSGSLPMGCAAAAGRCFVTLAGLSEIAEMPIPMPPPSGLREPRLGNPDVGVL